MITEPTLTSSVDLLPSLHPQPRENVALGPKAQVDITMAPMVLVLENQAPDSFNS